MKRLMSRVLLLCIAALSLACEQFHVAKLKLEDLSSVKDLNTTMGQEPMVKITEVTVDPNDPKSLNVVGTCLKDSKIQLWEADPANKIEFVCLDGTFSKKIPTSGGEGSKNVYASCSVGTKQAVDTRSIVVDLMPPQLQLSAPMEQTPFQNELELIGICEANLAIAISGDVQAPVSLTCAANGTFNQIVALSNNDGVKTIRLAQVDAAKNKSEISRAFIRDTVPPAIQITSPAANSTIAATLMLGGNCESGLPVEIAGSGSSSKSVVPCEQGKFLTEIALSAGNGQKQITAAQTDKAGNTATDSRSFNKQAAGPQILIASPAALTEVKSTLTLTGSCQAGLPVQLAGTGLASASSIACNAGAFSADITLSNTDGAKQIRVSQKDANGVEGADVRTFIKDSTAPIIKILEPVARLATQGALTLQGSCETGITIVIWGPGASKNYSANCSSGAFTSQIQLSDMDGDKEIRVSQTDVATNYGTDIRIFVRDTTPPAVKISSPLANATVTTPLITVSGSCEGTSSVQILGGGVKAPLSTACATSAFSASVALTDGDGVKALISEQLDSAGNKGSHTITVTRAAPAPVLDGKVLYANNCAACHNPLETTTRKGRTATQISAAIVGPTAIPQMTYLKTLTSAEIAAIASVLGGDTPVNQATNPFNCDNPSTAPILAMNTPRLTKQQLMNTYRSLLGATIYNAVAAEFAGLQPDGEVPAAAYTPEEIGTLNKMASKAADTIAANSTNLNAIVGSCASTLNETCARTFIDSFGLKAMRRPPTTAEKNTLVEIFKSYSSATDGIKGIVRYLLQAPQFVFHLELGADADTTPITSPFRLTQFELASRISYLLTDTMPDDSLFQSATAGQLSGTQITAQIDRLLVSTAGKEKVRKFYDSYLKLEPITKLGTYPDKFLNGLDTNGLAVEMQRELDQYIETMVFTDKAGYQAFLTSKRSFARTPALAQIYGHTLASSSSAVQTMGEDRKGIFMRAPMLLSFDVGTHPILRGVRIQKNILCEEIGDPPAVLDNPNAPADLNLATYSSREFYRHKTNSSSCLGCHSKINPPGFLLEGFDALGRTQTSEFRYDDMGRELRSFPIVTTVEDLNIEPGLRTSFKTASEFVDDLAISQKGPACFVRQAFRYYQKRKEKAEDSCALRPMYQKVIGASGSMLDSIRDGINSNSLQYKMSRP